MNAKEMRILALLGMAAGLTGFSQLGLEAAQSEPSIDLNHVIAKPACKAQGGCGGFTASRNSNHDSSSETDDDDDADDTSDFDDDDDDDQDDDNITIPKS